VSLVSDGISLVSENIQLTDGHRLASWLLYNCNMFQRGGTISKIDMMKFSRNERWRGTTNTGRPSWGHQDVQFCISKVFKECALHLQYESTHHIANVTVCVMFAIWFNTSYCKCNTLLCLQYDSIHHIANITLCYVCNMMWCFHCWIICKCNVHSLNKPYVGYECLMNLSSMSIHQATMRSTCVDSKLPVPTGSALKWGHRCCFKGLKKSDLSKTLSVWLGNLHEL
jgi:hypothetical protein